MNWEKYRRPDRTLDLCVAWKVETSCKNLATKSARKHALNFMELAQIYAPIRDPQVASLAMAIADFMTIYISHSETK